MTRHSMFAACVAGIILLPACAAVFAEQERDTEYSADISRLNLRISNEAHTRSAISPDESRIDDVCVMAYRQDDGRLAAMQTAGSAEEIDMELTSGTYNIYVTANMGTFDAPYDESGIGEAYHTFDTFLEMGESLPMCWKGSTELKAGTSTTILAKMERLVSKVGFNVETGVLEGLEITSVRLCQGATALRPFMEGGNRIMAEDEAADGDYATEDDLKKLNAGETIYFYVTENCNGTLLPDNADPWAKVPDSIGDIADLCTYVEMKCKWNEDADYEGTVTYRFFLGEDALTNFDIRRNSMQNLTLYLEEDSFDRISWKIDASQMQPVNWTVYSNFDRNFHDRENFYVTENIRIDFSFDDKGRRYWEKRNNDFILAGIGNNDKTAIRFEKPVNLGNGRFYAMGTCISAGYYDIMLIDSATENVEYIMDYGTVHTPKVMAGIPNIFTSYPVMGIDRERQVTINGNNTNIYLYLVDKDGFNLNQKRYYGCDLSLCDWDIRIVNKDRSQNLNDLATISSTPGETENDSYVMSYQLGFENDGKDESRNQILSRNLGKETLDFIFTESYSGAEGVQKIGLYCDDIEITLKPVPDDRKASLQSEFMYAVNNPSNIPIIIRGLKLNTMEKEPFNAYIRPIICSSISGKTSAEPLLVTKMPYTVCSLDGEGARYASIDGQTCFAADDSGIKQSQIPDQKAMFHTFEAGLFHESDSWEPEFFWNTDLYDTDGHSATYGEEGFMNCGTILHTGSKSLEAFDDNNGISTDFKEYGDLLNKESIGRFNGLVNVNISINEKNEIIATSSVKTTLNISVSGSVKGHIRCVTIQDPFFTIWGHYFTHEQEYNHNGTYTLGSTPVTIDGSALAEAFELMREIEYYSVPDAWDIEEFRNPRSMDSIVREYLKPYGIDLTVSITSPDGIPVAVRFTGSVKYDYKISSPVKWYTGIFSSVTIVPSTYSGFDNRLDDDDCPPGALFEAEMLNLQPSITYDNTHGLYYMTK